MKPSVNIERAVLVAMIHSEDIVWEMAEKLEPTDFSLSLHSQLYEEIKRTTIAKEPIDKLLIIHKLGEVHKDYIESLFISYPEDTHLQQYCEKLVDLSKRRSLWKLLTEAPKSLLKEEKETNSFIAEIESALLALGNGRLIDKIEPFSSLVPRVYDRLMNWDKDESNMGLATGLIELDKNIIGLRRGKFIVLAGRTSMGKTTLALNIACNIASRGTPILIFSAETEAEELTQQALFMTARISDGAWIAGIKSKGDTEALEKTATFAKQWPLYVDNDAIVSVSKLQARSRRMVAKHGIKLIIVDYIQKVGGSKTKASRYEEVSEVSGALKAIAMELKVPVIGLSQLHRDREGKNDRKPNKSDLRESGKIEEDADIIIFIHREDYYKKENRGCPTELIVDKVRGLGKLGTVQVSFLKDYNLYRDKSDREPGEEW